MAFARTTWQLALVAALVFVACSGSRGGITGDDGGADSRDDGGGPDGNDGGGSGNDGGNPDGGNPDGGNPDGGNPDGGLMIPDAGNPTGLFPLRVSADGGSLVANDGSPFFMHGEAAWSLIVQVTTAGAMQYLSDRRTRGVNTIMVSLIEHFYSDNPPANTAGVKPFAVDGDFSTPNEAYFAHADQVIDLAASQGIAVLLFPSYLGLQVHEGWRGEMAAMGSVAGAPKCVSYGTFLGRRYANRKNIIWTWGGDFTPIAGSTTETCQKAIRDALLAASPAGTLSTTHWEPESNSRTQPTFASSIDVVGVYTYLDVLARCRDERAVTPRKPTFLIETCYEHETFRGCSGTASEIRRRGWWGFLRCGAGEISGNKPIWHFGSGWQQELASAGSNSQVRLVTIANSVRWQTLAIDDLLITAGRGSNPFEVVPARTADRQQALIYASPGAAASFTVNLSRMSGPVTATWQDPTAVRSIPAGENLTGSRTFNRPGNNNGNDTDWVLVLSSP
jgi:hypothetical protein